MADVTVSVVVPTYNRSHLLARLVDALARQRGAPQFELVVVDNGSTDDTARVLEGLRSSHEVAVRAFRLEPNRGPAPARNLGWRRATGSLVVFTDDDCVPQPTWLAAMGDRLRDADFVQGRVVPHPGQLHRRSWFDHHVEVTHDRGFYETCNIAYRREVLERLGGFDEGYQAQGHVASVFGDDTDLGWRAREAGYRYAFEPEAVVWHDVRAGRLRDRLRDLPRQEGVVLAVRRHPRLRDHLETRWFYKRSHPLAMVALCGLATLLGRPASPARWLTALALGAPWLAYQGRRVVPPQRAHVLPRLFVVDIAEIVVLARASLRYRTPLL